MDTSSGQSDFVRFPPQANPSEHDESNAVLSFIKFGCNFSFFLTSTHYSESEHFMRMRLSIYFFPKLKKPSPRFEVFLPFSEEFAADARPLPLAFDAE